MRVAWPMVAQAELTRVVFYDPMGTIGANLHPTPLPPV